MSFWRVEPDPFECATEKAELGRCPMPAAPDDPGLEEAEPDRRLRWLGATVADGGRARSLRFFRCCKY